MDKRIGNPAAARVRLYRSILFVPASNERALAKAPGLAADAFVLDLEDSVAPDAKDKARRAAAEAIESGAFSGRELIVRVNAQESPDFQADLESLAAAPPDAVLVPKVTSGPDLESILDRFETSGLADLPFWSMIETAAAILRLEEIAGVTPRLAGLVFGANDLARDLMLQPGGGTSSTLDVAAALTVIAARAGEKIVIGPVYNDIRDADGFKVATAADAAAGFDGKALIHPAQIDAANAAFSPSAAELKEARAILAAFEKANSTGAGVAVHDGKMIEELHVRAAERLLATAAEIARRDGKVDGRISTGKSSRP